MKGKLLFTIQALTLVLTACGISPTLQAASAAPKATTYNIADYYPLCVGSQWHYQGVDEDTGDHYEVTQTAVQQVSINGQPAMQVHASYSWGEVNNYSWSDRTTGMWQYGWDEDSDKVRFDPPIHIPALVTVGQSFSGTSRLLVNGVDSGAISWTIAIESHGSINVPAGSFNDCLVCMLNFKAGDDIDVSRNWFARDVGEVNQAGITDAPDEQLVWAKVCGRTYGDGSVTHDVALTSFTASPTSVMRGQTVTFSGTVKNNGKVSESGVKFTMTTNGTQLRPPLTLPTLTAGQEVSGSLKMKVPLTAAKGEYLITGTLSTVTGETNTANNGMTVKVTVK